MSNLIPALLGGKRSPAEVAAPDPGLLLLGGHLPVSQAVKIQLKC